MTPLEIRRRIAQQAKPQLPPRKPAPAEAKAKLDEIRARLKAKP